MKKSLILGLLFFVAVASMHAQDAKMVVKGNLVNVGEFKSSIPVELRETAGNENTIKNQAGAEMRVVQLTVDANTKVDNAGNLCVGCDDSYSFHFLLLNWLIAILLPVRLPGLNPSCFTTWELTLLKVSKSSWKPL